MNNMNQKICKHPDGCQNKEPRHCLNKCCQAQEGTVGLSSAEKDAKAYLQDRYETDYTPEHWIKTVSEYAGQQVAEKNALLKEARRIFSDYLTGKSSLRLFKADARIFLSKLNDRREAE